jgi:hypothetical protein
LAGDGGEGVEEGDEGAVEVGVLRKKTMGRGGG